MHLDDTIGITMLIGVLDKVEKFSAAALLHSAIVKQFSFWMLHSNFGSHKLFLLHSKWWTNSISLKIKTNILIGYIPSNSSILRCLKRRMQSNHSIWMLLLSVNFAYG